ncbi:transmembrane protein 164-like [Mytilus trossulus]|uniref:transmembrane protein 164-like n=1 Tax=Mytilus trossulus TaxID=6551 RepID=UPI0030063239
MTENIGGNVIANPGWFDWSYTGVNFELAGNGGDLCQTFLSVQQRIIESVFTTIVSGIVVVIATLHLTLPNVPLKSDRDYCGKRILLVVMCTTFGIELGFKLATRQMIYILNPCHIATMMQIFCLAAPPSKLVTAVFRIHLHMLSGAPIAILFPVVNTRLLPFEIEIYYIQHILMLIIPFYLILKGGVYNPEPMWDLSWAAVSVGSTYIYHFITLQYIGFVFKVNLNNMLCPAISDPFYGPYYRLCALFHQTLVLPFLAKFMYWICKKASPLTVCDLEETKLIDIMKGCLSGSESSRQEVDNQGQEGVTLEAKKHTTLKHRNGSGDLTEKNGVLINDSRQPRNGHLKTS